MSFSYNGDPSNSALDKLRFALGDTDPNEPIFQDEELNWIVDNNKEERRLAVAFRYAATQFARKPDRFKLGPQEESNKERLAYYREQADRLEHGLSWLGTPPSPDYQADAIFEKGMMANE